MHSEYLQPLLDWIAQHQTWAGLAVFLLSISESLLIVGLFVPGTIVMFGIGTLVATGSLELWETLGWATLGAIVGDGVSYWIGYYYKDRLRGMWPLRRYPGLVARGETFFLRHGGKSVLFGRFVGPVRPVIPTIAGMMGMSPMRFTVVNVASAVTWAPAYLLPGIIFGASLGLASEVASRLAVLVVGLLVGVWLTVWGMRRLFLALQPRAGVLLARLLAWSRAHPVLGGVTAAVIDPDHPEAKGLVIMAGILALASWAFLWTVGHVVSGNPLTYLDSSVAHIMQGLRTPWADQFMVLLSGLGDASAVLLLVLMILLWLAWQRRWFAAAHWVAAVAFAALLPLILQVTLEVPRPGATYNTLMTLGFPGGHAAMSMIMYGFLSVLVARELPGPQRWLPYATGGLVIIAVSLSHLYLGARSLSDVVGGLTLGLAWIALLGIAYVRHQPPGLSVRGMLLTTLAALVVGGGWYISRHYDQDMQRYAPRYAIRTLDTQTWWAHEWQTLPARRIDLGGGLEQPLTVQWAGTIENLRRHLQAQGWHAPAPISAAGMLNWLTPNPILAQLPVLPQAHDGRHEALLLVHTTTAKDRQLVLRLWPSDTTLDQALPGQEVPLWVGTVTWQHLAHPLPLFTVPFSENEFNGPLHELQPFLTGITWRLAQRPSVQNAHWNGDVVLISQQPLVAGNRP
ncbi:MAG: LssY C-terminal domain-containing protein [Gammaproteobacteria bacterium]|nr:LssY C-terminal domain-containing protein [Gammaproteobacteria bacterium]